MSAEHSREQGQADSAPKGQEVDGMFVVPLIECDRLHAPQLHTERGESSPSRSLLSTGDWRLNFFDSSLFEVMAGVAA
jgi:hypothetical protein